MSELSIEDRWTEFKTTHNKSYDDAEEEAKRLEIFKKNVEEIDEHNKKYEAGEITYEKGINAFSDLLPEEIKPRTGGLLGSR